MKYRVKIETHEYQVEVVDVDSRPVIVLVDGERFEVWPETESATVPTLQVSPAKVHQSPPQLRSVNGQSKSVFAPIPGVIQAISIKAGDSVNVGQELCVLEAMKMKNIIRATKAGRIEVVHVAVGQQVKHHDKLLTYGE